MTPDEGLEEAVKEGLLDMIKFFLSKGVEDDQATFLGACMAEDWSCMVDIMEHGSMHEYLVKRGASYAIEQNNLKMIKFIIHEMNKFTHLNVPNPNVCADMAFHCMKCNRVEIFQYIVAECPYAFWIGFTGSFLCAEDNITNIESVFHSVDLNRDLENSAFTVVEMMHESLLVGNIPAFYFLWNHPTFDQASDDTDVDSEDIAALIRLAICRNLTNLVKDLLDHERSYIDTEHRYLSVDITTALTEAYMEKGDIDRLIEMCHRHKFAPDRNILIEAASRGGFLDIIVDWWDIRPIHDYEGNFEANVLLEALNSGSAHIIDWLVKMCGVEIFNPIMDRLVRLVNENNSTLQKCIVDYMSCYNAEIIIQKLVNCEQVVDGNCVRLSDPKKRELISLLNSHQMKQ